MLSSMTGIKERIAFFALLIHGVFFSTLLSIPLDAFLPLIPFVLLSRRPGLPRAALILAGALEVSVVISLLFGSAPGPTMHAAGVVLGGFGFLWLGATALSTDSQRREAGKIWGLAAVLVAASVILLWVFSDSAGSFWMVSPLDLSTFLFVFGIAGRCYWKEKRWCVFADILVFGAIILLTSRAYIIASAAAFLYLYRGKRWRLILALLALAAIPLIYQRISNDPLAWNRFRFHITAINLIRERPWFGWGWGSFDAVSDRALLAAPSPDRYVRNLSHAHSEPLEIIFEIGIPLGVLVIFTVLTLLNRLRFRSPELFAAAGGLLLVSIFYFPFRTVFPLYFLAFVLGAAVTKTLPGSAARFGQIFWGGFRATAATLFLIYAAGLFLRLPAFAPFDAQLALEKLPMPHSLFAMKSLEPERAESEWNLAQYMIRSGSPEKAIHHIEAAIARAPYRAQFRYGLAEAYLFGADRPELARRQLRFLAGIEPFHAGAWRALGEEEAARASVLHLGSQRELGRIPYKNALVLTEPFPVILEVE